MAIVKGPLFSLGASGTVGGAVVYSIWKGRSYVRRHVVPSNPKSAGQLSSRAMVTFLSQYWTLLSTPEKADWETRAAVTNISPFNAFLKYNLIRWATDLKPSIADPAAEGDAVGTMTDLTLTPALNSMYVAVTIGPLNQNWGILIYRRLTTGLNATRDLCVHVMNGVTADTFTWLDTGLITGTDYYYRANVFSLEGLAGNPGILGEEDAQPL